MTQLRALNQSLPMQLLKARETTMTQFRPLLREHGLTEQQWRVLRVLAAQDRVEASQLAQDCVLLAPSLTRILNTLTAEGLISKSPDPTDQRRTIVSLTAEGWRKYRYISPDSELTYQSIEQRFGKTKLRQLYQLLDELNGALTDR